jgi:transcriptional regulator with XRE-family HTH domain
MATSPQNTKLLKAFGNKVRCVRQSKGISQEVLAELAELDRTYISGVERGLRNISLVNISAIAKALKVHVAELTKDL